MRVQCVFLSVIFTKLLLASSKIHGGPRGRFSNANATRRVSYNHHVSAHHHHFSYHPPSYVSFMCRYCKAPTAYPVYHGLPPTYVYKFRESNSKFGLLLTGLALYNIGRSASEQSHHGYTVHPGEACSLQILERNYFEETLFPCFMMSTFMDRATDSQTFNNRSVDIISSQIDVKRYINNSGSSIAVNRMQDCIIWHNISLFKERYHIPCALLKEYADTMKPAGVPVYIWLPVTIATVVAIYICCHSCFRKKKEYKEEEFDRIRPPAVVSYYTSNNVHNIRE